MEFAHNSAFIVSGVY